MIFFGPCDQNNIYNLARQAIESTYDCTCNVIEHKAEKDKVTKRTSHIEEKVTEKQKCKLSFQTIKNTNESETENSVTQTVKLFIAPELKIKTGSKIEVTDALGNVVLYKNSGQPAIYQTHQEIVLEIWKGWA